MFQLKNVDNRFDSISSQNTDKDCKSGKVWETSKYSFFFCVLNGSEQTFIGNKAKQLAATSKLSELHGCMSVDCLKGIEKEDDVI